MRQGSYLCLTLILSFLSIPSWAKPSRLEGQVLSALNQVRRNPKRLIPDLKRLRKRFDGKRVRMAARVWLETEEGPSAVEEAIRYLQKARPIRPLRPSLPLERAARDHQADQSRSGETSHSGSQGSDPGTRIRKYGEPDGKWGENISYGYYGGKTGRDVIIGLIVDDGVSDRGHRTTLFDPEFRLVGIACGPHPRFKQMCVLDFAAEMGPKK